MRPGPYNHVLRVYVRLHAQHVLRVYVRLFGYPKDKTTDLGGSSWLETTHDSTMVQASKRAAQLLVNLFIDVVLLSLKKHMSYMRVASSFMIYAGARCEIALADEW